MNLSMRWLGDYIQVDAPIRDYVADMTMSGSKVEAYDREDDGIENVIVGKVLSVDKHPNADSLVICQIDVGRTDPVQIVTGADNVTPGVLVPVAMDNSTLPGGKTIKKGKLRGEVSEGMLCSLSELGLTVNDFPYAIEDGIFLLEEDCQPGDKATDAIGLNDTVVEFEITSNRPDCLSVLGLARETAATYDKAFRMPEIKVQGGGSDIKGILSLTVENKELCSRYCAAAVENVKIGHSPRWLRERLRASGVRPINNIVDITNYVMLEYGHPMHAFDLRHVAGAKIIVRNAKEGETITTLDGVERPLSPEMLVIADEKAPTAVAGVMGGEWSGVYDDTATVIFEAACFDGAGVRRTAKKLGMRTESSGRFEKGLDSRACMPALKRACELVELLGAGTVADGFLDADSGEKPPVTLLLEPEKISAHIGVEIPREQMVHNLELLGFAVEGDSVIVPSFRMDIACMADLAEEIVRIYGYNNIPTTVPKGESRGLVTEDERFQTGMTEVLVAQGYSEIKTYSFFSPKNYDKIRLPQNSALRNSVVIRNPLGEDTSVMRTTALPSLLGVLGHNYKNRRKSAALFELATEYLPNQNDEQPVELKQLLVGCYGEEQDFFTLKGAVETLLNRIGVQKWEWKALTDDPTYHPGRCAVLEIDGDMAGVMGEMHPLTAENYEIGARVCAARLDYNTLYRHGDREIRFRALPRFPASTRDLALVCTESLPVGEIEKALWEAVGSILEKVELFDVYRGAQVGEGSKSVAYSLTLRASDRTLTDEECDAAVKRALKALNAIGVTIRS
ncbi:MAG: phenylalanine--tRNA ligase subunit beta [Oscillospiraceae bacterium]